MSQTNSSLLDEVVQWSQETCRQELKSIITDMFLPHIGLSELEDECFSKILPKAVTMFDRMMKEIMDQVGACRVKTLNGAMMQIIDALTTCVRHVGSFKETPDIDAIRSLPTCILKVLRETFQHCKGLFKEAYSLQKALLELLEPISLDSSASEEEVSDIVTVIHNLLDICSIISNLDMALHVNTWKFVIKQSLKYQSLVEEHLHHGDISSSLCDNLLASFLTSVELAEQITHAGLQESTQSPEYKLFQKTAKMCRFFANTLVHYIKKTKQLNLNPIISYHQEFKCFLTKYCNDFHQLYLQIMSRMSFSKFPPSLCAPSLPPALSGELHAAALVPIDAFLLQLLPLRPFAEIVLQQDLRLSPEHELPHCLLLVNVLGQLSSQPEEVLQLWYSGSQLPLYQALFTSFRRCYTERQVPVLLPGVMMKGQAQVQVSLHNHLCVQLCASVAALPPVFLCVLERCLVQTVLQADAQTALLATDVWCFTARYGTAELCLHHVVLVAQLVKACTTECYQSLHLGLLLKRMVFLMTPEHQMELLARFPPSDVENLSVWRHVLLRALSQDARHRVETDIISLAQKALTDWQNGGYKLGQVDKMNTVLRPLLAVVRVQTSPEDQCVLSALRVLTQLWLRMSPEQVQSQPALHCTLQLLLSISAVLVKNIEPQVIYQALLCVDAVVSQQCADQLTLAALEFLSSLGKIFVSTDSQSQILPRLSGLFGAMLSDRSWPLHQHALEAFSHFAEITNHEEVISQSLCVEETKAKVVNYLSRPCPKKARQEFCAEEEFSRYVTTAESALKALQALTERTSPPTPPPWLESRLQELQTILTHIRTATHTS
ncbi:hypothetical protein F7725_027421 [Dissostichus mawsoni]|uniref:Uncharacterized protein n=1 Tax=Dissostichus mawsoni TaxID=36200 RepID=A0A7J5XDD6_DISMA|nr:hypothetical protein F7725_027421 [Dissostichus mawsoni]